MLRSATSARPESSPALRASAEPTEDTLAELSATRAVFYSPRHDTRRFEFKREGGLSPLGEPGLSG